MTEHSVTRVLTAVNRLEDETARTWVAPLVTELVAALADDTTAVELRQEVEFLKAERDEAMNRCDAAILDLVDAAECASSYRAALVFYAERKHYRFDATTKTRYVKDDGEVARAVLAAGSSKFPEGDPLEVLPSDSRAESQTESNGPSGSPNSPSGRASSEAEEAGG